MFGLFSGQPAGSLRRSASGSRRPGLSIPRPRPVLVLPSLLLDLRKAFALVQRHHLSAAAAAAAFPMWQVYLLVQTYRSPRVLDVGGEVGDPLQVDQTNIPGCTLATCMLQL
eukprot:9365745-Pyramimonas_sp.AAC.1